MKKLINQVGKMKLTGFVIIGAVALSFALVSMKQAKSDVKWTAPADADKKVNPIASDATSIAAGKKLFTKNCASCHGTKGKGDGDKAADLSKSPGDFGKDAFQKQSDGAIFWKMTEGRKPMPSFKNDLSDEQRWQLVNYLRTFAATPAAK